MKIKRSRLAGDDTGILTALVLVIVFCGPVMATETDANWVMKMLQAREQYESGELISACSIWEELANLEQCPVRHHARHLAAQALFEQYQESIRSQSTIGSDMPGRISEHLKRLTNEKTYPLKAKAEHDLCRFLSLAENWSELIESLPRSTDNTEFRFYRARALFHLKEFHEAEILSRELWLEASGSEFAEQIDLLYREILKHRKKDYPSVTRAQRFTRARSLDSAGQRVEAASIYREIVGSNLDDDLAVKALIYLAKIQTDTRENSAAMDSYQRLIKHNPSHSSVPTALFRKCIIHKREKNFELYLEDAGEIINKHPSSKWWPVVLMGRGDYWRSLNRWEDAGNDYRKVINSAKEYRDTAYWKWAWLAHDYGNYNRAITRLEKIQKLYPNSGWDLPVQYWLLRLKEMNGVDQSRELDALSQEYPWEYYGHQAAVQIKKNPLDRMLMTEAEAAIDLNQKEQLLMNVHIAEILEQTGYWSRAALEWKAAVKVNKNDSDGLIYRYALALNKSGDIPASRRQLISRFSDQLEGNSLPVQIRKLLYPVPDTLKSTYLESAERVKLDPLFALAVTLQESGFDQRALSHNLAGGLMQVMPELFLRFSKHWEPVPDPTAYADPAMNVRAGTEYLAWLLERFNGSIPKALAGYNAGEHRVEEWEKLYPYPDEIWVEHIPFQQTRMFVKHVWKNYRCYTKLYGSEFSRE